MQLDFDEERHTYTLTDGITDEILPSVTQILKAEGFMNYTCDDGWYMERGSHVHRMIELHMTDSLNEETLDPMLRPYLTAFRAFEAATGFLTQGMELPLWHPIYHYAGKPDLWGPIDNRLTLIDVKTGSPAKWHTIQLAAYFELLRTEGIAVKNAANLYLAEDGSFKYVQIKSKDINDCRNVFLSALTIFKWKKENL